MKEPFDTAAPERSERRRLRDERCAEGVVVRVSVSEVAAEEHSEDGFHRLGLEVIARPNTAGARVAPTTRAVRST